MEVLLEPEFETQEEFAQFVITQEHFLQGHSVVYSRSSFRTYGELNEFRELGKDLLCVEPALPSTYVLSVPEADELNVMRKVDSNRNLALASAMRCLSRYAAFGILQSSLSLEQQAYMGAWNHLVGRLERDSIANSDFDFLERFTFERTVFHMGLANVPMRRLEEVHERLEKLKDQAAQRITLYHQEVVRMENVLESQGYMRQTERFTWWYGGWTSRLPRYH